MMGQVEHCHERPDMYVGNTCPETTNMFLPNINHLFNMECVEFSPALGKIADEVLVNAFDNIQHGTKKIEINIKDETITVRNDGGSVPVVKHQEHGMYVPTMVFGHILTGENYNDKGEIRGANYNDRGHTEVGDLGWMKYTDKLYNNNTIDIEERPSR